MNSINFCPKCDNLLEGGKCKLCYQDYQKSRKLAFKWFAIGYRNLEYEIEAPEFRLSDNDLQNEFDMEWEFQETQEKKTKKGGKRN